MRRIQWQHAGVPERKGTRAWASSGRRSEYGCHGRTLCPGGLCAVKSRWHTQSRHEQERCGWDPVFCIHTILVFVYVSPPDRHYLQDGVHELRAKHGHAQYRILYFFHGKNVVVLAHAFIKEGSKVPDADIERA